MQERMTPAAWLSIPVSSSYASPKVSGEVPACDKMKVKFNFQF